MNRKSPVKTAPVVLFDGVCNFCNGTVNFLIRQDKAAALRFAALQSPAGQDLLAAYGLDKKHFESFVFIENGKTYMGSEAGLRLYRYLPWYWQWVQAFRIVPVVLRDAVYAWVARNRYRWFGKKEACMIPSPEVRERFL
ncbi:MAG TPA: thiol-disulfide oxidoreductase DCC family protein [Flavisolibacter sp.]|nr:thiol-disulfide oxidoreductase DCC family protein [Flavisolibacter sp.]